MAFQFSRLKTLQWLLLLLTAVVLSACSFHLRGAANLPFRTVYLDLPRNSPLANELTRYLHLNNTEVVDHQENADAIFQVLSDKREQKILTLTTSGQASEYSLYLRFTFQLKDPKGAVIIPPATIVLKRDMTYDANLALAKEQEQVLLYRDMQSDLVQQIIRRLAASKPGNTAIEVDE